MAERRKPTLHEIAAMPMTACQEAMRKHYDPDWGKRAPEGTRVFRVVVDWELSGTFSEDIEAEDEDEAKEKAHKLASEAADDRVFSELTVTFSSITEPFA
ncbi:hypothetical protein EDF56_106359 [Novosphingobium sp. PhB165]|uniref:hypothetical protein n=1 Tax=Novosphingobium sp. PhB165 TaxID=2485105 RepID=UPI00104D7BC6|nr:hypothetical protein [Novosphingobium sp. PhB165]TCM17243.1 hypothetical protein EDF56_106359 [Novosphingobium sp. PhB165]